MQCLTLEKKNLSVNNKVDIPQKHTVSAETKSVISLKIYK